MSTANLFISRGIGRDILFFGGSIIFIRMIVSALQEEASVTVPGKL